VTTGTGWKVESGDRKAGIQRRRRWNKGAKETKSKRRGTEGGPVDSGAVVVERHKRRDAFMICRSR